ncbi:MULTISPECIES: DUF563 domain-containing protein [Haloferax]|uniref:glycosyltransferase family 61 protein n=1 Tax=Haloferax TaxID=2251 RepID=UPI00177F44D0|nr:MULTISPECIES: glycosyltransferase family 61 protein [Haloferax]
MKDPRNRADEVVTLPEKPSLDVEYRGESRESAPRQLRNFEGTISSPDNHVYVYEDVEVVGRAPVARIDGRYLLPSWFGVDTAFFVHQMKFMKRVIPLSRVLKHSLFGAEPARHIDHAFILNSERGSYRYCWFHETIPKLRWYEEYCEVTGETPTLIVNSPLRDFQRRSLELLGYDSSQWIEHGHEISHVDRLAVAPHPIRLEGNPSSGFASEIQWAGERIVSNLPDVDTTFSKRVYISRADASRRRVQNEEEVIDLLESRGFEAYEPGRFSLEEQIKLFAGADIIVGPHGLAYVNLMFCDSDTSVVELFAQDGCDESYFVLANEYDMDYECMVCESIFTGENSRAINNDIVVDVDGLETIVDSLIEKHETESTVAPTSD